MVPAPSPSNYSNEVLLRRYVLLLTQGGVPFPPLLLYTEDRKTPQPPSKPETVIVKLLYFHNVSV